MKTKNKTTQGPWRVEPGSTDVIGYDGAWVADFNTGDITDPKECENNARMASIAPELRELAERLTALCPSKEGLGGHTPIGAFIQLGEQARQLLSKINP